MDKLDKVGWDNVEEELISKEIPIEALERLKNLLILKENTSDMLEAVSIFVKSSETGKKGITEIEAILKYADMLDIGNTIEFDVKLARGLNYYTGAILEVKALGIEMGSISGGGRYDDLTGIFGLQNMSGVGISYGADRIYDILETLGLFPDAVSSFTQVLICHLDNEAIIYCLPLLNALREQNISSEIYPDAVKIKKQLAYADKNKIKYVVIAGSDEMAENVFTLKDMYTSEQYTLSLKDVIEKVRQ